MGLLIKLWNGLRQGIGLVLPLFAKASDFRSWGPGLRWAIHIAVIAVVLVVLQWLNSIYLEELSRFFPTVPLRLRQIWLPILFLLLYTFSWLLRWLLSLLTPDEEASDFPDVDEAWQEAQEALGQAGLDIRELPLFLVLGKPVASEEALFDAAQLHLLVTQAPDRPDAPLHVYANQDAVYVTCPGVSLLARQAAILAGEAEAVVEERPAFDPYAGGPGGEDEFKSLGRDELKTLRSAGPAKEVIAIMDRAKREGRAMTEEERRQVRQLAGKAQRAGKGRPSLLKNTAETALLTARLEYLCRLLMRSRRPYCPLNGMLALIPLAATDSDEDANATGDLCARDLSTVRRALQTFCPLFVLVCDLETAPGFRDFLERFPAHERHRRVGQRFPLAPDLSEEQVPTMIAAGVQWICSALVPTWIYKLFRLEGPGRQELAEVVHGNAQLYKLMSYIQQRQKLLARAVTRAVPVDPAAPLLFGGCYLGASGQDPTRDHAFVPGVFRRLLDEQNYVSWTDPALAEDAGYQRWTVLGYVGLVVTAVVLLALVAYLGFWPRS